MEKREPGERMFIAALTKVIIGLNLSLGCSMTLNVTIKLYTVYKSVTLSFRNTLKTVSLCTLLWILIL